MARHAHEDALSDAEFEQLVDGAKIETAEKYIRLSGGRTKKALGELYT